MNPLIEKFEEVYGKKPKEGGLIEQLADEQLGAADSPDTIKVGDTVIPTAELTPTGINLTGSYVMPSALISNGTTCSPLTLNTRAVAVPHQTPVEQQFFKVLEDVGKGRATVSTISAEIDPAFTGFGGQIRYTVEIVGQYP